MTFFGVNIVDDGDFIKFIPTSFTLGPVTDVLVFSACWPQHKQRIIQ